LPERKRNLLQIPQGTESFHLEEAYIHRRVINALDELFTHWGYLPAQIPVFDFFDTYRSLLQAHDIDKIYRLIDREGDLLMLRSDITLFLAKQVGTTLSDEELPLRIFYADTILRHQDREDISKNEFFQTGAELIGRKGEQADLEILTLLTKTLLLLDLPGVYLHIGSRAFFNSCFEAVAQQDQYRLLTAVVEREGDLLATILEKNRWKPATIDWMIKLFQTIGDDHEIEQLLFSRELEAILNNQSKKHLSYLISLYRHLEECELPVPLRIDLSEIGNQPYHNGIVFQVYMENVDSAIASGGRYDELIGAFGHDTPSVGFSLLLRKVEPYIRNKERFSPPKGSTNISEARFSEAYRKAEEIRKQGGVAVLS
jgi:ATP phosphoribosyltransferase regulatory subunit